MEKTISSKVARLEEKLSRTVLGDPVPAQILQHIFLDKFRRSSNQAVSQNELTSQMANSLLRQIVQQKFEQRLPSGNIYDDYIRFLSGEQISLMEISYTKQQQKQKQKQKAKSQDNDTMDVFAKANQLTLTSKMENYFDSTIKGDVDGVKQTLSLPLSVPIFTAHYINSGKKHAIHVYPTVQFLYSHHIKPLYIDEEIHSLMRNADNPRQFFSDFVETVCNVKSLEYGEMESDKFHAEVKFSCIRQNPQYSLVGIQPGVYIIGMKDQFNSHDCATHPLNDFMQYAADEIGFVLFDKTNSKSVDEFGPYFIEQYILLDALSKQEVAQNVITYYCNHKETLERCLEKYDEKQGKGFICWRFLMNQATLALE